MMKKVVNILTVTGFMFFGAIQSVFAQEAEVAEQTFHQVLKQFSSAHFLSITLGSTLSRNPKWSRLG
jgi:hypothetical protein